MRLRLWNSDSKTEGLEMRLDYIRSDWRAPCEEQ